MKSHIKKSWLGFAALALIAYVAPAKAVNPASLDITVQISATKSLAVNTTFYNYGALAVNTSSVSGHIMVTNDSGALIETYTLQGANAISSGGQNWTLAASPGTDIYALAAQFSAAAPTNLDGSWTSDDLTTSAIVATASVLGNTTAGESGAAVVPSAVRNLWFRLKTPTVVSDVSQRKATLTLAVQ